MHSDISTTSDMGFEVEPRFSLARDVSICRVDSLTCFEACMVNFSRNGFCVRLEHDLRPGEAVLLEIAGWPQLRAHVVWSHDGKAGCQLTLPLAADRYEAMILSADAVDRAGEWNI